MNNFFKTISLIFIMTIISGCSTVDSAWERTYESWEKKPSSFDRPTSPERIQKEWHAKWKPLLQRNQDDFPEFMSKIERRRSALRYKFDDSDNGKVEYFWELNREYRSFQLKLQYNF